MRKFLITAIYISIFTLCEANLLLIKSKEEMLNKCVIAGQGKITKIEKIGENWREVNGEKFLYSTDYRASFKVVDLFKGDSKLEKWFLKYSIPGPSYGQHAKRFSYVKVGKEYSVYGTKYKPDDLSKIITIHIQNENDLRLGTAKEREKIRVKNEEIRRKHIEKVRAIEKVKKPKK